MNETDQALTDFLGWIKPIIGCIPPIELRNFDQDPRFTGKTLSAIDVWKIDHRKTCERCRANYRKAYEAGMLNPAQKRQYEEREIHEPRDH